MDSLLRFAGEVSIQAAADQGKTPRVSILAYSGGEMRIGGFGPVAVDLDGASIDGDVPLLADHEANLDAIAGQGRATIRNQQLYVEGILTEATAAGQKVLALARSGISLQASIGFVPDRREQVAPGQTVNLNGRTLTAGSMGLTIVRSGRLREVSLLPIGADPNTQVTIAAKAALQQKGKRKMANEIDTTTEISDELKAAWDKPGLTETERVLARWNGTTFNSGEIRQQTERFLHAALGGTLTYADFERELLRAQVRDLELKAIRAERPQSSYIQASSRDTSGNVLEAALLCHMGHESAAASMVGEQATEAARKMRLNSLHDIMRASLQHEGRDVPAGRNELIRAAFSTVSLPGILGNTANKISQEAYRAVPSVARVIAKKLTANDFKTHTGYRLTGDSTFEEVGNGGEIKHGKLGESSFVFRVATFAKMFGLTRQDVVNDDLGKFDEVPRLIGRGSAMKLEQLFWTLVLANTGNFFHADNGNYIDGTGSALGITGLTAAVAALRQLVDSNGDPISITPKFLVVPPELEAVADQLFASTNIVMAASEAVPDSNPFKGKYQPQVSPYLSNSNYAGYSADAWYLFGDPADVPAFGIAYLDGQESPTIEQAEADFNTLGIQFRGYHDFGVCQIDPNGGIKSKGTT